MSRALSEAQTLLERLDEIRKSDRLMREYAMLHRDGGDLGPYDWQAEYHAAGRDHVERCMVAANRVGKTRTASAEVGLHLTGWYPDWWEGRRFTRPVRCWVGSETNEASRDIVQNALLGDPVGTGWIPKRMIHPKDPSWRQAGISNVADTVRVKHASGGWSLLGFKTYEQGRARWQGTSQHLVWFDEEPPQDIYTEGLTRTLDAGGMVMLTFTPLKGPSDVVVHFMDGGAGIHLTNATWTQAPHLGEADRARLLSSYPEHERDTRARGIPMMGEGAVYPVPDEQIICEQFKVPDHFRRICGIDFGIGHNFAAVWLAYDADMDIVFVTDAWRVKGQTPAYHAAALKARGEQIPVAWPHDGHIRDKGSGTVLVEQYRAHDVNTLGMSARYENKTGGGQPREPAVMDILERMRTGRFKVFRHLEQWLEEKRMYHRKDGQIVAERDDLMSASQYGVMMIRFADSDRRPVMPASSADENYDPLSSFSRG